MGTLEGFISITSPIMYTFTDLWCVTSLASFIISIKKKLQILKPNVAVRAHKSTIIQAVVSISAAKADEWINYNNWRLLRFFCTHVCSLQR